jgi:hypothetical protein
MRSLVLMSLLVTVSLIVGGAVGYWGGKRSNEVRVVQGSAPVVGVPAPAPAKAATPKPVYTYEDLAKNESLANAEDDKCRHGIYNYTDFKQDYCEMVGHAVSHAYLSREPRSPFKED